MQKGNAHIHEARQIEQHEGCNVPRRCRQSSLNPPVHTSQHTAKSVKAAKASDTPRDASFVVGSLISCGLPSLGSRGVRPSPSIDIMHTDLFCRWHALLPCLNRLARASCGGQGPSSPPPYFFVLDPLGIAPHV